MKLRWSERALSNIGEMHAYIFRDNPRAAASTVDRIESAAAALCDSPRAGHKGRVSGTREFVVPATPYILAYTLEHDAIYILAVIHGKQRWPENL